MSDEYTALIIFAVVYGLIIGRRKIGIPIWMSMSIGAILMLVTHTINPSDAFKSINFQVIGFLFGMFSIIGGLEKSGLINFLSVKMLSKARTPRAILVVFVIAMGVLSAFLVNDSVALVGIPLIVYVSKYMAMKPQILLFALAFGVSVGSIMTPIGSPQNVLIAIQSGIKTPFTTFLSILGPPTMISLVLITLLLRFYFRKQIPQHAL